MGTPANWFGAIGAIFGFLGVAAGAFGAHALANKLEPRLLHAFEVGARYQLVHAVALLAVAWIASRHPGGAAQWSGWMFVAGVTVFSGSLYALALTGVRWLGAITPIGGVALLVAWALLAVAFFRANASVV